MTVVSTGDSRSGRWWLWTLGSVSAAALLACPNAGKSPTAPTTSVATVTFLYQSRTGLDPLVLQEHPRCVEGVEGAHIHPSWREFARVELNPRGGSGWQVSFADVPLDRNLVVRVNDPNACASHPHGAATENVFANEVLLVRVVDTPGPDHGVTLNNPTGSAEPGLAFFLSADGGVIP